MSHYMIEKQKELMAKVPHTVRPDVYPKMLIGKRIMENVLLYLNSCGHKPWRPKPLDTNAQTRGILAISREINSLVNAHAVEASPDTEVPGLESRQLISALGIIEETLEFLNSTGAGSREQRLEEITDVLFFYLESVILGGFSWAEIEEEYVRKHAVNLKRYEDAEKGNWEWDKREEGRL